MLTNQNERIRPCCGLPSEFLISYKFGKTYNVCPTCFNLPQWNEGIISKEIINNAKRM